MNLDKFRQVHALIDEIMIDQVEARSIVADNVIEANSIKVGKVKDPMSEILLSQYIRKLLEEVTNKWNYKEPQKFGEGYGSYEEWEEHVLKEFGSIFFIPDLADNDVKKLLTPYLKELYEMETGSKEE